ncbi:hypothetical protein VKT23_020315 [Stygiomarasmius scandens]|uniref:Uncharacterized protein n=1 Tax=Marasmiellus scandens TaxID=2682957 RepID=A0ABR1IN14_9AGAR
MSTGSFSNIESSARPEPGTQDRRHGRYQGRKRRNNRHQRKARGPIYQNDDGFTSSMQGLGKVNFSTGSSQSTFENTSFMRCGRSINSIYCPHASSPRELFNFCDQSQEFESCSKPVEAEYTTGRDIDLFTNSYGAYITNSSFYVMDKCIGAVEMPDNPSPEFLRAIEAICAAGAPRT